MTTYDYDGILAEAEKVQRGEKTGGGDNAPKVELNGIFDLKVVYAKAGETSSTKNPQISLVVEVQSGPQEGDSAWWNLVLTPKSKGRFGKTLMDLGVESELLKSLAQPDPDASPEDKKAYLFQRLEVIAEELLGWEGEVKAGKENGYASYEVLGASVAVEETSSPFAKPPVQVPVPAVGGGGFIPRVG